MFEFIEVLIYFTILATLFLLVVGYKWLRSKKTVEQKSPLQERPTEKSDSLIFCIVPVIAIGIIHFVFLSVLIAARVSEVLVAVKRFEFPLIVFFILTDFFVLIAYLRKYWIEREGHK